MRYLKKPKTDPGEQNNLAYNHPELIEKAMAIIKKEHIDSPVETWNFKIKNK